MVAGVQNVRYSALPLSLPQLVWVGRKDRLPSFSSNLQRNSTYSQHPPDCQDNKVISLKRHICESSAEIRVECSLEYIQSDVRKACVQVTVNSQDYRIGANEPTSQYVQLIIENIFPVKELQE